MKLADVQKTKTAKTGGYILYEGPSRINGEPIVVIVTMKSSNIKTGNMASMWILHKDIKPTEAAKSGADEAVCGGCKLRRFKNGACYVNLGHAPLAVFKAYHGGKYKALEGDYSVFDGVSMRFGAYGDPYAMPMDILIQIKSRVRNNTSYTHQWRENDETLKQLSMASTDNIQETLEAQAMGWRTFRVANEDSKIMANEIVCPNYTQGVQCINCKLCSGNATEAKNIVIPVHGALKNRFK